MFDELRHYTILAHEKKVFLMPKMEIYADLHNIMPKSAKNLAVC